MLLYIETKVMNKIIEILAKLNSKKDVEKFFNEIFTKNELETLEKRWRILELLSLKKTQRDIVNSLNVSLCKVTRGSKILKDKNAITRKFLVKE